MKTSQKDSFEMGGIKKSVFFKNDEVPSADRKKKYCNDDAKNKQDLMFK